MGGTGLCTNPNELRESFAQGIGEGLAKTVGEIGCEGDEILLVLVERDGRRYRRMEDIALFCGEVHFNTCGQLALSGVPTGSGSSHEHLSLSAALFIERFHR